MARSGGAGPGPNDDGDLPSGAEPLRRSRSSIPRLLLVVVVVTLVGSWFVGLAADDGGELRTAPEDEQATPRSTTSSSAPESSRGQVGPPGAGGSGAEGLPLNASPSAVTPASMAPPTTTPPIVPRPVPPEQPLPPTGPADGAGPPWAASTRSTPAGYVATDVGCASGNSASALDAFFRARIGPVLGLDYQHVYDLGGDRRLWLFQDTFVDHGGGAARLDRAAFVHNSAMLQEGSCFTLLHRGSSAAPTSFEPGTGERRLSRWFWPLGGEASDGQLHVFWVEMAKTADPRVPDGLGWIPVRTWIATYSTSDLGRVAFRPAPDAGVAPIYGYAVASDESHSYLFGNSFDQNLARQGGYWACPCSATAMWLARVPRGRLADAPEYWTGSRWSGRAGDAQPISRRFHAENPMQPRFVGGQWVAATKVDGYWGDELAVDVAAEPWGPWTTVIRRPLAPRGGDPLMNTYHAHLMPWLDGGALVVSVSQNARDMGRHAFPHAERYRLQFFATEITDVPPPPPTIAPATTTAPPIEPQPTEPPTTPTTPSTSTPNTTAAPTTPSPPSTPLPTDAPATTVAPATTTTDPCQTSPTSSTSSTSSTSTTTTIASSTSTTSTTVPCRP